MAKLIELKLHCELDEGELRDRGQQLAEALREARRVDNDRRLAAKDFKEQLEEINGRMHAAAEAIRSQGEYRLVACQVIFHTPSVGSKRTVRLDTGEVVKEESMTRDEQQLHLYEAPEIRLYEAPENES